MSEYLEQKVDLMKREIDALQVAMAERSKPWYRNVSTLLAVTALLFSFGTTYVSYQRTQAQDIQSGRQELRGLIQRLSALPKENLEAGKKYADDPGARDMVAGFINQEGALLARQAAELARRLPANTVSGAEYQAIAYALQSAYDLDAAAEFVQRAIKVTKDFNTEIAALRMAAGLHFTRARPEDGRVEYQRALSIFSKYPGYDPFTTISTSVWTELSWAYSEAPMSLALAHQHLDNALALSNKLPSGPGADQIRARVRQAKAQFSGGLPPAPTMTGPQLGTPASVPPQ